MRAGKRGVETMTLKMIEPRLLTGLGLAASIIGHLALTLGLLFADAHPFESMPSEAITVDIVAPEEAKALPRPAEQQKPDEPEQPDPIDFSLLTAPVKPTTSPEPPGQQAPQQKPQIAAAPASRPSPPPGPQPATAKPQGTEAQQPTPSLQASSPPASPPAPAPDITVKYGVALGLPSGNPYGGVE